MITGTSKRVVRYVPESERTAKEMQTVVWIVPKTGHDSNVTASRYARAEQTGRRGRRELDVETMDVADIEEFLSIVEKWEWFQFSDQFKDLAATQNQYPDDYPVAALRGKDLPKGVFPLIEEESLLERLAVDVAPELMVELFEVANSVSKLTRGEKKTEPSSLLRSLEKRKED